jgi:VanZ family protein
MKRNSRSATIASVFIAALVVSFLLFYDFDKSNSRIINGITSYGHIPLFGFISLGILWLLSKGRNQACERKAYFQAGAITVFLGILTEIIQIWTPSRTFKLTDILSDTIGAAVFLAFAYSFQKGISPKVRILLRSGALFILFGMAYPIILATIDTVQMGMDAPLLSSFETSWEMTRWASNTSTIKRTKLHATDGEYALEVHLAPGIYPGVSMVHLINDWRNYATLSFDAFLSGSSPLKITVRINDEDHNQEYNDRFNKQFILQPNHNHITINLAEVKKSPSGRLMDMARIQTICVFSYNLRESRQVYFDNFRLENQTDIRN